MIDEDLFIRGHILTKVGTGEGTSDDFDIVIPEYYFMNVLGLTGEVIDSNGSEYDVVSLIDDGFEIEFVVAENEFETEDGSIVSFDELTVRCTGTIIPQVNGIGDPVDVLQIESYDVVKVV